MWGESICQLLGQRKFEGALLMLDARGFNVFVIGVTNYIANTLNVVIGGFTTKDYSFKGFRVESVVATLT